MNISIGLDKNYRVVYHGFMLKVTLDEKNKDYAKKKAFNRVEFVGFVADQFRKLTKKNLRVPITLYHL